MSTELRLIGLQEAVARPAPGIPPRAPGSVRRSSHVDMTWPDSAPGDPAGVVVLEAAATDVVTRPDGSGHVVAQAQLRTTVERGRKVTGLVTDDVDLTPLLGLTAASGWRAAARQLVPEGLQSPLGLLLDEVPIAVLLSFYAGLRSGALTGPMSPRASSHMRDLCAGWAADATPMRAIDAGHGVPLPQLVPVPRPQGHDPLDTEPRPDLLPGRLRRSRRIDVLLGEVLRVDAMFRDSWSDPTGGEGILHEYGLAAEVSRDGTLLSLSAEPRVLPYAECPSALASVQLLVGQHVGTAATAMPPELSGASSCTHLNDLLRCLACVPALAAQGETRPLR